MPIYSFQCNSGAKTEEKDTKTFSEGKKTLSARGNTGESGYIKENLVSAKGILGWKVFFYDKITEHSRQKYLITAGIFENDVERDRVEKHLFNLTTHSKNLFFSRAFTEREEEFDAFAFSCPGYSMTLKDLAPEAKKACAFKIFAQLIKELSGYAESIEAEGQEYLPWRCVSEDTVFIKQTKENGADSFDIQILPILPKPSNKDAEEERFSDDADIKTDIYTIADLYFSLKGGIDDTENDKIIKECLITAKYKKLRPSLERLLALTDPRGDIRENIRIYSDDSTQERNSGFSGSRENKKEKKGKKGFLDSAKNIINIVKESIQVDNDSTAATDTSETEN